MDHRTIQLGAYRYRNSKAFGALSSALLLLGVNLFYNGGPTLLVAADSRDDRGLFLFDFGDAKALCACLELLGILQLRGVIYED